MVILTIIQFGLIIFSVYYYEEEIKKANLKLTFKSKFFLGLAIFWTIVCMLTASEPVETQCACSVVASFFYCLFLITGKSKSNNINSQVENQNLEENKDLEIESLKEQIKILKEKELEMENLKKEIEQLRGDNEKEPLEKKIAKLVSDIEELKTEKKALSKDLNDLKASSIIEYTDVDDYSNITSQEIKNQLNMLKLEQDALIKSNKAIIVTTSQNKSNKKAIDSNIKQLLRNFNSECNTIINNVTIKNIDSSRNKIEKSYTALNKLYEVDFVQISKELYAKKLKELTLMYSYIQQLENEKEQQKAIREQLLEEEKVRKEIEREKAKLDKEEKQFKNEVSKLMTYLNKSNNDAEKQLYIDKINELEDKLKLLEKDKENVLQREQNTRAGYVYIISNVGSFGENIYKIGMTRRLEPMDRIKELGDASVPFSFDVHALIFSDDAPALETILHQTFKDNQVNKLNSRKEFYNIDLDKIKDVVKNNYNNTVDFTDYAEAYEYRESLKITSTV